MLLEMPSRASAAVRFGFSLISSQTPQQHPGRAEAALQALVAPERLLEGVHVRPRCQALDGLHVGAVGLHGEHDARAHAAAVQQHGAGPAGALLAAQVGSHQGEVAAQEVASERRDSTVPEAGAPFTVTVMSWLLMGGLLRVRRRR